MAVGWLIRGRARSVVTRTMRDEVVRRLRAGLAELDRKGSIVTVVFTDDDEIRQLNSQFRKMHKATDVLSFHLQELQGEGDPAGKGINLGDIIISVETARRRAPGKRLGSELQRLAVHGFAHLFGHDHKRPAQAKKMFALERKLRRLPLPPSRLKAP